MNFFAFNALPVPGLDSDLGHPDSDFAHFHFDFAHIDSDFGRS